MAKFFHVSEADTLEASGWRIFSWDIKSLEEALLDASVAASRSDSGRASVSQSEGDGPWVHLFEVKTLNGHRR